MKLLTDGVLQTVGLIASLAGMIFSFYVVVYFTIDTQAIRIMLWVIFAVLMILSIGIYMELLKHYNQTFLKLPSTWMTVVNFILLVIFGFSFGSGADKWATPWTVSHLNDMGAFMAVVMSALLMGSLVSNVLRTNVLFGIVLTTIQSLRLPVVVTLCYFLPFLLGRATDKDGNKI